MSFLERKVVLRSAVAVAMASELYRECAGVEGRRVRRPPAVAWCTVVTGCLEQQVH